MDEALVTPAPDPARSDAQVSSPGPQDPLDPTGSASRLGWTALLLPVLVGAVIRLWNVRDQVLGDDELHAVRAATSMRLGSVLTTYHESDHSIPLTALYRGFIDLGGVLSETGMRVPILLCSIALPLLAPRLVAPLCGARVALLWSWALALSPLLVLYGRMVRSYAPVVLLATCGVIALLRFMRGERLALGGLYALCAALAIWLHPGAGPFVVAPLAWAALERVTGWRADGERRGLGQVIGAGALLLVLAAALLAPARESLWRLIELKSGAAPLALSTLAEVGLMHAGVRPLLAGIVLWLLAAAGCVALWRDGRRDLAVYLPVGLVGQLVGLYLLAPDLGSSLFAARAFLVALPLALLAGAAGADGAVRKLGLAGRRRTAALAALVISIVAAGPLADRAFWTTSFRQHDDFVTFTHSRPRLREDQVPGFYLPLESAVPGALIELPWHPFWGFGHSVPAYQERHGRRVIVGNLDDLALRPELAWRSYVRAEPAAILAAPAAFAVVHLDFEREEQVARLARGEPDRVRPHPQHWARLRREAETIRAMLDSAWGPPDYDDGAVAAWNLERVRAMAGS